MTYELDSADQVWNRAALDGGGPAPGEGDRALASLLLAHGLVMNGGVLHAVEALEASEIEAACDGFDYFDLGPAAAVLAEAARASAGGTEDELDDLEARLHEAYWGVVPDDETLAVRFRRHFDAHPGAYSPLVDAANE